jgi:hypothetical protein
MKRAEKDISFKELLNYLIIFVMKTLNKASIDILVDIPVM